MFSQLTVSALVGFSLFLKESYDLKQFARAVEDGPLRITTRKALEYLKTSCLGNLRVSFSLKHFSFFRLVRFGLVKFTTNVFDFHVHFGEIFLAGIDSGDGTILWYIYLGKNVKPLRGSLGDEKIPLYIQRTTAHYHFSPQAIVVAADKVRIITEKRVFEDVNIFWWQYHNNS